jgi:hypothetical protein
LSVARRISILENLEEAGRDPLGLCWLTFASRACQLSYLAAGSPKDVFSMKFEGKCRAFALHICVVSPQRFEKEEGSEYVAC